MRQPRSTATLATSGASPRKVADADALTMYRYDTLKAACGKYLLNVALEREASERLVEAMSPRTGPGEQAFCNDFYMSDEQVRELEARHGAIGGSLRPLPFATLDPVLKGGEKADGSEALPRTRYFDEASVSVGA